MSSLSTLRRIGTYVALWSLIALGFAFALGSTEKLPWEYALRAGFGSTVPAALLGLLVLALCDRVPLQRTGYGRLLAMHAAGSMLFSALWCGSIVLEILFMSPRESLENFLGNAVPWQLMMGVVVYAVITGVAYARASRRREEEQTRAAERAETLRLRAELGALRSRLDPHFLFNVLATIGTLAEQRPSAVHVALEHLASLLRRRLGAADEASDVASLAGELTDLRDYLALEALRYGDRLRIVEDIDSATLALLLPRFTLQPIVENALRHGLAPRASGGVLSISARRLGERWMLAVADDGVGAEPARFDTGTGIGVSVVRERLRLRFHGDVEFLVTTAPGSGCRIELRMPAISDDDASVDDGGSSNSSNSGSATYGASHRDSARTRELVPSMEPTVR